MDTSSIPVSNQVAVAQPSISTSVTAAYSVQETARAPFPEQLAAAVEDTVEISEAARVLCAAAIEAAAVPELSPEQLQTLGMDWYRVGLIDAWELPGPVTPVE